MLRENKSNRFYDAQLINNIMRDDLAPLPPTHTSLQRHLSAG